jgi:Tol biopolymer transport system component
MQRYLVLCLSLLLALAMAGCGDSNTPQVSKIAYIHVTGGLSGTTFSRENFGQLRANASGYAYSIMTMNVDGTDQQTVLDTNEYIGGVELSRDGKKIIYIGYDSTSGYDQVYLLDVTSKQSTQLTTSAEYKYDVMFTPDGKTAIYRSYTGSYGAQLWSVPTAGGNEKLVATSDSICLHEPHVSLDGSKVVFDFHDETYSDALGYVNTDGTGYHVVANTSGIYTPAFSADNKKVFYADWSGSMPILKSMNIDGTNVTTLITSGASIDPYPVGSKVLVLWDTTGDYVDLDIYSINPDGSSPKKLTSGGINFMQWVD